MSEAPHLRFGIFDFDLSTGELRRNGMPVRLQSQPAQVLRLLIENADQIVTRETLQKAVWGTETFVDFERGLNFCIAQIRSALGDSADSPRFVRTVPKRGYQFIAPVAPVGASADPPAKPAVAPSNTVHTGVLVLVPLVIAAVLFGGVRLWNAHQPAALSAAANVAVARFDNDTGRPDLDRFVDGLTDSVVAELTRSVPDHYGVIGNAAILRRPRDQRDLLAIASTLRARYVVLGQVQGDGKTIHVLAHLIRLPDQTHLRVSRLERTMEDPLRAQSEMARRIARDFVPRLLSDDALSRPVR